MAVDEGDTRITKIGAFLRRTSIDELPNLVNIVKGEMSLVGPRPTIQVQVDQYTDRQRERLTVRPGLTGWAQVNGRASLPWSERIELDLHYIERATLRMDLRILVLTARMAVTGHGLYRGEIGWLAGLSAAAEAPTGRLRGPCRCAPCGTRGSRRTPRASSSGSRARRPRRSRRRRTVMPVPFSNSSRWCPPSISL